MRTEILSIDQNNIDESEMKRAGALIAAGELVAFPTETVYGLGGDALDPKAAKKIYAAKGRPSDNPLIVHISDKKQIYNLVTNVPEKAEIVMDKLKKTEKKYPVENLFLVPEVKVL